MKKAIFCIDVISDNYVGYTDGQHWNGWECPWLPKSEVLRFLSTEPFNDSDDTSFRWEGDKLVEIINSHKCESVTPMREINGEICYQLGNGWVWEIAQIENEY